MEIAGSVTVDPIEFAERRDPWGFASDVLSRHLLPFLQKTFPNGYHIARFHADMSTQAPLIDEIVVRLEVVAGSDQFDLPTLQSGIRELLIASFKAPAEQAT